MPSAIAETTMVYRDEQSGELGGLTARALITQDDSHVFCRTSQIKQEFFTYLGCAWTRFTKPLALLCACGSPSATLNSPNKYLGTPAIWDTAENALREICKERNADYFEGPGEAALYGPKLDFMAKNAAGREWQVATIQLDMNLPERFDLTCINENGEKERIVMIHSAITGSIERCMAFLLEHFDGAFPLWLSPVQARVLPY